MRGARVGSRAVESARCGAARADEFSSAPRGKSAAPPDLLEGVTLADDQKAKIAQIREETKSHLAAVANDKNLSPEAADAMRRGYARLENGKILEVLTLEQQQQVYRLRGRWSQGRSTWEASASE